MIKFSEKRKKREKERKISFKAPKKAQDIIPFTKVYESGICRIGTRMYTKTYEFTDINYSFNSDDIKDSKLLAYAKVLNALDASATWKLTLMNSKRSENEINNEILMPCKDDNLQKYRDEMNRILMDKIAFVSPYVVKRYLTCCVVKNSFDDAVRYFNRMDTSLVTAFSETFSMIKPLNDVERLRIIHNFFRPEEKDHFCYDGTQEKKFGESFKNYIAPYSFEAKFDHFTYGDRYGQGMLLTEYPTGMEDDLIMRLFDLNVQLTISIDIHPITNDEAKKLIESKELAIETEIYKYTQRQQQHENYSNQIPFGMNQQREIVAEWMEDVNNGDQHVFFCMVSLLHTADSLDELNHNSEEIINNAMGRNIKFEVTKIPTRQLSSLITALPFGTSNLACSLRPMSSNDLATFVPFIAKECCHPHGMYCGTNQASHNFVSVDRRELLNGNCWVLAISGGGKSMNVKFQIFQLRLKADNNTDIIIIDPQREYGIVADALGGETIVLSNTSPTHINPFDLNSEYGKDENGNGDPVKEKAIFISSFCEQILINEGGITAMQRSLIDRAVRKIYEPVVAQNYECEMPTMKEFVAVLRDMSEQDAKDLAVQLELYSEGSMDMFAHQTNVDTESSLLSYDILNLSGSLKNLGLLIVLDNVINRLSRNRFSGKTTYVIIDEIYLLFSNPYSCEFLETLWKTIRKYNGFATGIIQNVCELVRNPKASDMLANSEFTIMLPQNDDDAKELARMYSISDSELQYIKTRKAGTGLIRIGMDIIPFENLIPKDTEMFRLMDTKPRR